MRILEVDGKKYSTGEFSDYEFRAKVSIGGAGGELANFDVYTTDPDKENVQRVLEDRRTEKVMYVRITYWCTREQDDAAAAMIDEWLKEDN